MRYYPESLARLLTELRKLPGVGEKTAQRLAFHMLREPAEDIRRLGKTIAEAHDHLTQCGVCGSFTDKTQNPCLICESPNRDRSSICVVEKPDDIAVFERMGSYRGLYHVLGGVLSALNHVRPDDLRIPELLSRVEKEQTAEVILALNPSVEGNATVTYLSRQLEPLPARVTQIAYGIPIGSELDYVDEVTLNRALESRSEVP